MPYYFYNNDEYNILTIWRAHATHYSKENPHNFLSNKKGKKHEARKGKIRKNQECMSN